MARSHQDLVQIRWIRPNIGQISTDSVKYRHQRQNPKPTGTNLKPDGPEPDDPTIITSRFRFFFSPLEKFRSSLGQAQTQPRPTRGHP